MTRRMMLSNMDGVEFAGWKAFFKIENEQREPSKQSLADKIKAGLMAIGGKHGRGKMVRKSGDS